MSAGSAPAQPPLANSYWVLVGRLLAGEYPAAPDPETTRARIGQLTRAGIDCFVNLTSPGELPPYEHLLPQAVQYHQRPIRDHAVPAEPARMRDILELVTSALHAGRRVYVHCRAGIGRTGTVIGCLLVERGLSGDGALDELNRAWQQCARARDWPSVPETDAQVEYVRHWQPALAPESGSSEQARPEDRTSATPRERFLGALVGLATADALAATEQSIELPAGAWTDDTAMALCLGESLLACGGFDARDQVERYTRWQQQGYMSATGAPVGITASTQRALSAAGWRRQLFPGSHDPKQVDPEPLARIAPVVMFAFGSPVRAVSMAGDAARITCQSPLVIEACRVFAAMLHAALRGAPKAEVLSPQAGLEELAGQGFRPRIRSLLRGRYRGKQPHQVHGSGGILDALEAALWALERTASFRDGALLAASSGTGSDVAAAAYGQLAGAYYALDGIPAEWRRGLARRELIEDIAARLLAVSSDARET